MHQAACHIAAQRSVPHLADACRAAHLAALPRQAAQREQQAQLRPLLRQAALQQLLQQPPHPAQDKTVLSQDPSSQQPMRPVQDKTGASAAAASGRHKSQMYRPAAMPCTRQARDVKCVQPAGRPSCARQSNILTASGQPGCCTHSLSPTFSHLQRGFRGQATSAGAVWHDI